MAAVLLGMLIAASFGSGDYAGGRASTSSSTVVVLLVSQVFSVVGAGVLVVFVSAHAGSRDLAYGAAAGVVNVVGLGLLYHGLARYSAGVVAPITAVVGAVVPVAWGLAHGERPSTIALFGVVLAVAAGAVISREPPDGEPGVVTTRLARGAPQACVAGLALGSSFVFYSETSTRSGQLPVLAARVTAALLAAGAVMWFRIRDREPVRLPRGSALTLALGAGGFDVAATALLVVAVRHDLLSIVAPVVSLAPGFTVILAWRVGGQRLHPAQRVGLVVALAGLALVALG